MYLIVAYFYDNLRPEERLCNFVGDTNSTLEGLCNCVGCTVLLRMLCTVGDVQNGGGTPSVLRRILFINQHRNETGYAIFLILNHV